MSGFYYHFIFETPPVDFSLEQFSEPLVESIKLFHPDKTFVFFFKQEESDSYDITFMEKELSDLWEELDQYSFEKIAELIHGWFHLYVEKEGEKVKYISIIDGDSTTTKLMANEQFVDIAIQQYQKADLIKKGLWAYDLVYESYEEALTEKLNDPAVRKVF